MPEDNSQKSVFNAGVSQSQEIRLHQNILNKAKLDLLSYNIDPEYPQVINYELCIKLLTNIFKEIESKCTLKEKELIYASRNVVDNWLEKHPIIKHSNKNQPTVDRQSLKIFTRILEDYETKVRAAVDNHDFNSPSKQDLSKSIIQM